MAEIGENAPALKDNIYRNLDLDGLTTKERKFILCFSGNPVEAAREAGYRRPSDVASRLLAKAQIRDNLKLIADHLSETMMASSMEILKFWTDVARGEKKEEGFKAKDRMRAAEMLGKHHGLTNEGSVNVNLSKTETNATIIFAGPQPRFLQHLTEQGVIDAPEDSDVEDIVTDIEPLL